MRRSAAVLLTAIAAAVLLIPSACGSSGKPGVSDGPSEDEVGAPVYPGALFEEEGPVAGSFKFLADDSSAEVVNWYRDKLSGMADLEETNESPNAITGNLLRYSEGDRTIVITILPQPDGLPTTLEIYVSATSR